MHSRNRIKGAHCSCTIPQLPRKQSTTTVLRHLLSTTMLYKPLVSLVMAFAAVSSVAASVTPAGGEPHKGAPKGPFDHAKLGPISPSSCNATLSCCDLPTPPKNMTGEKAGKPDFPPSPQNVTVGGCSDLDINAISKCAKPQVPVCCKRDPEDATKAHDCQPVSLNNTN
ncbi:hypothetical protein BC826DRAFT_81496 [Russula brevipes]|nr:hypothetical protein BC826DRAFT_81496 [Russula brevipes]